LRRFSEDARYLICGSDDGKARIWHTTVREGGGSAERDDTIDAHISFISATAAAAAAAAATSAAAGSGSPTADTSVAAVTTALFVPESALVAALGAVGGSGSKNGLGNVLSPPPPPSPASAVFSPPRVAGPCMSAAIITSDTEGVLRVFVKRSVLPAAAHDA
jgi:hypothetical protein